MIVSSKYWRGDWRAVTSSKGRLCQPGCSSLIHLRWPEEIEIEGIDTEEIEMRDHDR
jgi:hypothetical protein